MALAGGGVAAQCPMSSLAADAAAQFAQAITGFIHRVLVTCADMGPVWSLGHAPGEPWTRFAQYRLLGFADAATLRRLRASEHLHRSDIEFLVVVDGDRFASAWGPRDSCGSLAQCAWRQTASNEAHYDESRWAQGNAGDRAVVRVRRKAFLLWPGDKAPQRRRTVYKD